LIKLVLFLALAYLCYRLLRRPGRALPCGRKAAGQSPAPPIDRSRVVDAEYREVEGSGGDGPGKPSGTG